MLQAQKDASVKEEIKSDEPQQRQQVLTPPQTVAAIRAVHVDPRRSYIAAAGAAALGSTAVILSEGSPGESTAYQYHRVAHVVTGGSPAITASEASQVTSRCIVTSSQDLAHILVAVTTTATSPVLEQQHQQSTVSVTAGVSQQIPVPINPRAMTATGGSQQAILAQSVVPQTLPQRIVLNNGGDVFVRLSPSIAGTSPQLMVLESSGNLVPSGDVTKVHTYSLATAAMSCSSSVQKVVLSTAGAGSQQQHLQRTALHHKAAILTHGSNTVRSTTKRFSSSANSNNPLYVNTNVNDIACRLSHANKLLSSLVSPSEGSISKIIPSSSIPSSPKQKRLKLDKTLITSNSKDVINKRKRVSDHFVKKLRLLQFKYYNQQAEYFFLKNGGNIMDHIIWKKKIPAELLEYLRVNKFDPHDDVKTITDCLTKWFGVNTTVTGYPGEQHMSKSSSAISTHFQLSPQLISSIQGRSSLDYSNTPSKGNRGIFNLSAQKVSSSKQISSVYESQIGSQEEIVERAKQEAYVMQRVGDLRKEGLWSLKRLPKCVEDPRIKVHWDYLLEEMVWLATDFAQERKWKKAAAKKCARMITRYFQEKEIKAEKAEKEEQMRMRKIASTIAREVKQFWSSIEKLVEYKQQTWLEEKRKKVLDVHLNFIVDQTEKYSSWLTQGMNQNSSFNDVSPDSSRPSSPTTTQNSFLTVFKETQGGTSDFEPANSSESDDEETIKKEEEDLDENEQNEEIKLLQQESEMSFEDFLETLPPQMLNSSLELEKEDDPEEKVELDDDYKVSGDEDDDEQTIIEQEMAERDIDHKKEIAELEAENELSIEELKAKYAVIDMPKNVEGDEISMEETESSSEEESEENEQQVFDYQIKSDSPSKEISDIAATAESFQPKGNTLSTTQVCTTIPFLLKHTLREYQHIGLDWLNAMYDKKLNGILADEMGLGKTIQTISILAHLACEKGVWGPHLIVVPTSVMLNWEMEFKKWCPAFKILTYYGTPKERKMKRVGWTKPNAFHVCITSYKLVVQDNQSFRRKKWKYLILDEAQHIKNFKSQRWQMLLNFQSSHRLLLTGTPLQNNLMELWSLMHFLMPNVFQSHKEFREWFVNPVTGMIEGSHEYNESLIKRLHKVLRPFLLRRLKCEVEKQLPKKYEHVVMCRLSKRQRYLYDDFMSQSKTKETLASGNFMSVINILMQLRKVCNHPNMFEERPIISSFLMDGLTYHTPTLVHEALHYDPERHVSLFYLNLLLCDLEILLPAYAAHRVKKYQSPSKLIVELDSMPESPPPCPSIKMKVNFCNSPVSDKSSPARLPVSFSMRSTSVTNRLMNSVPVAASQQQQRLMVIPSQQQQVSVTKNINPVSAINQSNIGEQQYTLQVLQPGTAVASLSPLGGLTLQLQSSSVGGNRVQCIQSLIGGIGRMVHTASGAQWLITSVSNSVPEQQQSLQSVTAAAAAVAATTTTTSQTAISSLSTSVPNSIQPPLVLGSNIATATVMPQVNKTGNSVSSSLMSSFSRPPISTMSLSSSTNHAIHNKPIGRVAPLNVHLPTSSSGTPSSVNHVQPVKSPVVHSLSKSVPKIESDFCDKTSSVFFLEYLFRKRQEARKEKLKCLAIINSRRCSACPIYGSDLVDTMCFINKANNPPFSNCYGHKWGGYLNNESSILSQEDPVLHLHTTRGLVECIKTTAQRMTELMDVIKRFVFVVSAVSSPSIQLYVSHPSPSFLNKEQARIEILDNALSPAYAFFHPLISNMKTVFPELRLIEYDCGKLQRLALLLRELKDSHHRVLIFTQMTRMLDILEQFLNYHGHTYLRLDGNTKIEQRQALMERFNADQRIFCFILSTRSGGIGVNLTGADTVIFYDSDWNPTMDAQAQDRCHRIGQTRDVHIYRLISERTVEENILKKANQKRLLGDLAIEGGNFNTAFFKKNTIHELFGIEDPSNLVKQINDTTEMKKEIKEETENFSPSQLEQALGMAEEEMDLQAARTAHAEAAAELAEFDESIPLDNDNTQGENEEKSPAEEELEKLMEQLMPVEKYAVQFLESLQEPLSLEQLKLAEEEIEAQKKDWELGHLKALKEEEEKRLCTRDDDSLLFCGRESNQIFYSENGQEEMPMWAPPTPPTSENDIYLDPCLSFWYDPSIMHESRLPPVFIKKEPKRQQMDPVISAAATTRKQKVRKDDLVNIPRSLFDRPSAAILKMRREVKLQKVKGLMVGGSLKQPLSSTTAFTTTGLKQCNPVTSIVGSKPNAPDVYQDKPEWLVHEDYLILQIIQDQQGIPLSLTILMPAHTPNWDLASDAVNAVSRFHRSARQCKCRYENVIMLREEGKIVYDPSNKKPPKKTKGIYKTKNSRPMKTSHLYQQDNNASYTALFRSRCRLMQDMAQKRSKAQQSDQQCQKQSTNKNSNKSSFNLIDLGINYDEPLNPMQIATNRAERITREKQKNQPSTVAVAPTLPANLSTQVSAQALIQVSEHLHQVGQRSSTNQQQSQTVTVTGTTNLIPHQAVIASLAQAQQLQQVQLGKAPNLQSNSVATSVKSALATGGSIMVNTAPSAAVGTFASITKALGQAGVTNVASAQVQNSAITAALSNVRGQRTTVSGTTTSTSTMTVQEMVAAAAASQVRNLTAGVTNASATSTAPAVVSVAGLATVQLAAASQRITGTTATTVVTAVASQMGGSQQMNSTQQQRNLAQLNQIQAIRQSALIRQRQEQQQTLKQQQQLKRLQVQQQQQSPSATSKTVSVGGTTALTVAAAQQRTQQVTMKQSRPLTDAEMTQFVKRQQLQQQKQVQLTTAQILAQAQLQQVQPQQVSITGGGTATLVKTVSAPAAATSVAIPVSAVNVMGGVNINVSLPQGVVKSGASASVQGAAIKGVSAGGSTTTITNQQLRQFQLQQQLLSQARKGGAKVAPNLTQLAKVPGKGAAVASVSSSPSMNAVQIVQHNPNSTQQIKGIPTAMTVQQIQQAMKAMPQNLPVVVTATPSLPGIQHNTATHRSEAVASSSTNQQIKQQSITSNCTTTSGSTAKVVVGQQLLQQVAASSATQHAVTLAVRATASQAQGQQQQVQIQVQPSSLVASAQQHGRIHQLSSQTSINIATTGIQSQQSGNGTILSSPPSSSLTVQGLTTESPTHTVVMQAITSSTTTVQNPQQAQTSMQTVIQAARQQQQQKASPYTMRLRNPPK